MLYFCFIPQRETLYVIEVRPSVIPSIVIEYMTEYHS